MSEKPTLSPMEMLLDYERRGGKILFWTCPKGCDGYVEWKKVGDKHVATCKTRGRTNQEARPQ